MKARFLSWYYCPGLLWIRIGKNGVGFHVKDVARHPLLFSERSGLRRRLQIKGWSLRWLPRLYWS